MKVLVVGGTGLLGGHAALHLQSLGHDVSLAARNPAHEETALAAMPFLQGDYVAGDFPAKRLAGFDWLVFAAGNDPRHIPPGADAGAHLMAANRDALPAFFRDARTAGIKRAVMIGSYYPQATPELVDGNVYIQSRLAADEGARATAAPDFAVMSLNAPFMVGCVPGQPSAIFGPYTAYAKGEIPGIPPFGPAGGTNFMSCQSLSEAIVGALLRGESGKAYLVGDENLSFADYFGLFFKAAGNPAPVPSLDQDHPLLPDIAIPQGRGNFIAYEPDAAEVALLGYRRHDVARAVAEVVAQFGGRK
jgi:dihydroflavonol-4-reductase